jgi:hypothetical protein
MTTASKATRRRAYDHRIREQVCRTGVRSVDRRLNIPRSTAASWRRRGTRPVVTIAPPDQDTSDLMARIAKVETRARILAAVVRLLLALLRVARFRLTDDRLPSGNDKAALLRAIASAEPALPLNRILRILHLSPT